MKIVWLSWKDIKHPLAGGAEKITHELAKRLSADGHDFTLITSRPKGFKKLEITDGYRIEREGGRLTVYFKAWRNYRKNHKNADLVIEEVNTLPFLTQFYVKNRRYVFFHQLARQIWFYQMVFPISLIGYLLEPIYLWTMRKNKIITVSNSTKKDILRFGFSAKDISIISEGTDIEPVKNPNRIKKYKNPTLLSIGAIRPMKRTLHQLKAFEIAKENIPKLKLKIAGDASGKYGQKVLRCIRRSRYAKDIDYLGRVNRDQKKELMQKCHLLLVTSVKEGWGLIVTEAATQGTPAVAYNVDGLRDSVKDNTTGYLTSFNNSQTLAVKIEDMLNKPASYKNFQKRAWLDSQKITFKRSYQNFLKVIGEKN